MLMDCLIIFLKIQQQVVGRVLFVKIDVHLNTCLAYEQHLATLELIKSTFAFLINVLL